MELDIKDLINSINLTSDVKISDIPDMELYMEQLTSFMDKNLENLKRSETDKILTKTMINSYTKDGLLMPPENKKKYSKQHVVLLIIIYHLKQILSINDIRELLKPILKDMTTADDDVISIEDIYSIFLDMKKIELDNCCDICNERIKTIEEKVSNVDIKDQDIAKLFLTVITLVAQAEANKRLAEKLIDDYFKSGKINELSK
jgi:DNA-binding transcriptional MerR regulator